MNELSADSFMGVVNLCASAFRGHILLDVWVEEGTAVLDFETMKIRIERKSGNDRHKHGVRSDNTQTRTTE